MKTTWLDTFLLFGGNAAILSISPFLFEPRVEHLVIQSVPSLCFKLVHFDLQTPVCLDNNIVTFICCASLET